MRYIAFLRGINVGGHTVKMDELRGHFEALGLGGVATFIASGNVIFEGDDTEVAGMEARIEARLVEALGFEVPTFLRTDADVAHIAAHEPFPDLDRDPSNDTSYVGFLGRRPAPAPARAIAALSNETDRVAVHDREIYWHIRGSLHDSTLAATTFEKALETPTTMRNVNTVRRLAAKYPPAG